MTAEKTSGDPVTLSTLAAVRRFNEAFDRHADDGESRSSDGGTAKRENDWIQPQRHRSVAGRNFLRERSGQTVP